MNEKFKQLTELLEKAEPIAAELAKDKAATAHLASALGRIRAAREALAWHAKETGGASGGASVPASQPATKPANVEALKR